MIVEYHLIEDAHYRQPQTIYDFILFLFPDSDRDRQQTMFGDRLRKFINLALTLLRQKVKGTVDLSVDGRLLFVVL